MVARRTVFLLLVAACLALAAGLWLGRMDVNRSGAGGESEAARPEAAAVDGRTSGTAPTLGEAPPESSWLEDAFDDADSAWTRRFPEAVAVDSRLVALGSGSFRRQTLLSREGERIPWVLWEDKLLRDEGNAFIGVGSVAHMGNVLLVEADPALVPAAELEAFLEQHGLFVERESAVADYLCLGFDDPSLGRIEGLIAAFTSRFPSAIAEFDTLSFPGGTPSDWDASRMWGLDKIGAEDAWRFESGAAENEVVVAIIDTGVQRSHPDLSANLFVNTGDSSANGQDDDGNGLQDDVSGWDFYDGDSNPRDDDGHGTHVAGIVGAVGNNGRGAVGVNWGVRLLPLKVGDREGLRTSAINDALAYVSSLKQAGVNIVATNNSYGSGGASATTRKEIGKHQELGIVFVAAAGNDGKDIDVSADSLEYPAGYVLENIVSVGSSNQEDALNASSNFGTTSVDISAPGSDIYSTYLEGGYTFLSGTSMASPMVAGAIGLLAQAEPSLTAGQLKARVLETGDWLESQRGRTLTGRRLNLLAALKPELGGHFVEVANISDSIILVGEPGPEVVFEVAAKDDATVAVEVVSGEEVGELRAAGNRTYRFATLESGLATLRVTATLEGVERAIEKSVAVGELPDVEEGLRYHYAFDGSGASETNLAGGSLGSVTGATRVASEYGSSLRLDSASENVAFDAAFSERVTLAALVRSDDLAASPHPRIVNMPYYYLYFSSGDGPEFPDGNRRTLKFFANYSNFGVWNTPPRSVEQGQWYFVVGSFDSRDLANTPRLFINGREQEVRLQQAPEGAMVRTGGLSYLGNNGTGDRAFEGLMADVRIYDRTLSAQEVGRLGASMMQDRWSGMSIDAPAAVEVGIPATLQILDTNDVTDGLAVDWHFPEGADAEWVRTDPDVTQLLFNEVGTYRVTAQVSDGVATRVLQREIAVLDGRLREGHYTGTSSGGGLAWLDVDPSLKTGVVTVYDAESGFYRIRESVELAADGTFASGEVSSGRIEGVALRWFELRVPALGLEFSGERQAVPSFHFGRAGDYEGGGIGVPGDSVRMEILSDTRVFLWREGPFADLASGTHQIDGRLSLRSASGAQVELTLDGAGRSATGSWGEQAVFLRERSGSGGGALNAGLVGGYPSGSGGLGLYAEYFGLGETPSGLLEAGAFSGGVPQAIPVAGPVVFLGAEGESLVVAGDEESDAVAARVARAVARGELALGRRPVGGIRLQAPISAEGAAWVGFSIEGAEPVEVLARGLGPSFAGSGAEDPKLSVYRLQAGQALALLPNDNWRDGAQFVGENESAQGAFRALETGFEALALSVLEDEAKDAALRVWLEPGDYLILLELSDGAAGSGLLEVFAL